MHDEINSNTEKKKKRKEQSMVGLGPNMVSF